MYIVSFLLVIFFHYRKHGYNQGRGYKWKVLNLSNPIGSRKKAKRGVDGVLFLYKETLAKGVLRQPSSNEKDVIWVKLDKNFFGLENDIFIGAGYRPPRENKVGTFYTKLEKDVGKYCTLGDIILMGDLNSRIGGMDQELTNIDIDRNGDAISKTLFT